MVNLTPEDPEDRELKLFIQRLLGEYLREEYLSNCLDTLADSRTNKTGQYSVIVNGEGSGLTKVSSTFF